MYNLTMSIIFKLTFCVEIFFNEEKPKMLIFSDGLVDIVENRNSSAV